MTICTEQQSRLPSLVLDLFSSYRLFSEGRFAPGTYTIAYDGNGRLTADGTRGVTSVSYHPWLNLPQTIKFDSGDWAKSDYWPDGTLRSRFTQTRRIDPISVVKNSELYPIGVIPDSTATIAPAAIVNPTLRTTRTYRGSFEIVSGSESYARVNTSTGYYDCKEKRHYYYLTNRQGSVMAVIDEQGATVQRTGLYPSGTPFVLPSDIRLTPAKSTTPTLTPATDRLHIGNRWLGHSGLNRYDNTARLHDPLLCRFDTPDPLATKFPGINPWTHTAANPANLVDMDGLAVMANTHPAQMAILNTLPFETWKDIQFDGNGIINPHALSKCNYSSQNLADLKALVESDFIIDVQVTDKAYFNNSQGEYQTDSLDPLDDDGYVEPVEVATDYTPTTGEFGHGGKTVFPTSGERFNSTDGRIHIFINQHFSSEGQAQMFSHEGYGHALFYIRNPNNLNAARHIYNQNSQKELNRQLFNHIIDSMNETHQNINAPNRWFISK